MKRDIRAGHRDQGRTGVTGDNLNMQTQSACTPVSSDPLWGNGLIPKFNAEDPNKEANLTTRRTATLIQALAKHFSV